MTNWNVLKSEIRNEFGKNVIINFYNDKRKTDRRIKISVLTSDLSKVRNYCDNKGYKTEHYSGYQFIVYTNY